MKFTHPILSSTTYGLTCGATEALLLGASGAKVKGSGQGVRL